MIFESAFETVQALLAEQIGISPDEITLESALAEDLGADSLDAAELLVKSADELDIFIPDDDVIAFRTVGDIVKYLEHTNKLRFS